MFVRLFVRLFGRLFARLFVRLVARLVVRLFVRLRAVCVTAAGVGQPLCSIWLPLGGRWASVGSLLGCLFAFGWPMGGPSCGLCALRLQALCVMAAGFWAACAPHGIAWIYAWNCKDNHMELQG